MKKNNAKIKWLGIGLIFTVYFLVTCHKLINASLWYDETIEYWYSKRMFGTIPGISDLPNMYERIISTFQPPLYNFVMHFWLKISDGETWFRFFGVLMGFIGAIGIYKAIKTYGNDMIALSTVVLSIFTYRMVYYYQECAEYCLLLGIIPWCLYFFIRLMQKQNKFNIIIFTILCVLAVYSQYGAAFPVIAMCLCSLCFICLKQNKSAIVVLSISYAAALIVTALPLMFLFLKPQIMNQHNENISINNLMSSKWITDLPNDLLDVYKWNFMPFASDFCVTISLIAGICIIIFSLFLGNYIVKCLIIFNIITWLCYYIAVKLGLYAYGNFGNRYNLFFIPVWIVLISISILSIWRKIDSYECKKQKVAQLIKKLSNTKHLYLGMCLAILLCFCISNWNNINANWIKEDIRGAVDKWYEIKGFEQPTLVYYAADSGFAYYVQNHRQGNLYNECFVKYMNWMRDKNVDEYISYIDEIYQRTLPDELLIVASHYRDDLNILVQSFTRRGYISENIFDSNGAKLIRLYIR